MAAIAADALLNAAFVAKEQFKTARDVIAEEIYVRLCLDDYPPAVDHLNGDAAELFKRRQG